MSGDKGLVLICDDVEETARAWETEIRNLLAPRDEFVIEAFKPGDLKSAIDELEARQLARRSTADRPNRHIRIDDADVLIVDFDLLTLRNQNASASETGERIAYLARTYANSHYIVALNQFNRSERTVFDLTLKGHPLSFADLNISSRQIANPGLWSDERAGYRPWSWPCLHDAASKMKDRAVWVAGRLDEPVLEALGLAGDRTFPHFTRGQLRFVSNSRNPETTTFRELVEDSQGGLRGKDKQADEAAQARIAAARVHKWLERMVLPGQNILIDAPHLVTRFPSLIGDSPEQIDHWQRVTRLCEPDFVPAVETVFNHELWLSRPAWIWADLQDDESIAEVSDPFAQRFNQFKFAEDVSSFYDDNLVRDFTPEFDSPWLTRFVLDPDLVDESDPARSGAFSIDQVRYEPGVQFAL